MRRSLRSLRSRRFFPNRLAPGCILICNSLASGFILLSCRVPGLPVCWTFYSGHTPATSLMKRGQTSRISCRLVLIP